MNKNKKGLADRADGDFILNESGTSVNVDNVEDMPKKRPDNLNERDNNDQEPYIPPTADEQKDTTD